MPNQSLLIGQSRSYESVSWYVWPQSAGANSTASSWGQTSQPRTSSWIPNQLSHARIRESPYPERQADGDWPAPDPGFANQTHRRSRSRCERPEHRCDGTGWGYGSLGSWQSAHIDAKDSRYAKPVATSIESKAQMRVNTMGNTARPFCAGDYDSPSLSPRATVQVPGRWEKQHLQGEEPESFHRSHQW